MASLSGSNLMGGLGASGSAGGSLLGSGSSSSSSSSNAQEKQSALVALQMSQSSMTAKLVLELKSKLEEQRAEAAMELWRYVSTELREVPIEELNAFLETFTKQILDMVKGDVYAKLGGILAIVALINADVCNTGDRISRFGNYLRNTCLNTGSSASSSSSSNSTHISPEEFAVIELASKAIARLTQVSSGTYTANLKFELIDHEVKRAFELLQGDKSESKRFAAVLILREIAFSMPTFFFQNVSRFFDVIFHAVRDAKLKLRESAVNALRAALWVTAKRETTKQSRHQHQSWYSQCYEEALKGFDMPPNKRVSKEDRIHGSLLVLCELLRCSNYDWEMRNRSVEEDILCDPLTQGASIISTRPPVASPESQSGLGAVRKYYQSAAGFKLTRSPAVSGTGGVPISWFGTVIVGKEDVVESMLCRNMLNDHYDQICHKVLSIAKNSQMVKNINIQNALLLILPKLAAFRKELFTQKFLSESVTFIDRLLMDKNRYNAFVAMGLLAVAVGPDIHLHLRVVLTQIKLSLPNKETPNKKRSVALDPAIFACISLLAQACQHSIRHDIAGMLDSMLSVGLSPPLTIALTELAKYIPTFKKDIADGLLKILSLILMQQPFKHPGTPKRLLSQMSPIPDVPDTASVVLGLRTLGSFDFEGHSLLQFVRHCADNYLNSDEKLIRLEAVETCSSLLKQSLGNEGGSKSLTITSTISEVLAKLLIVGITDQEPKVRACVMNCLDECFDYHLAQAENLSALFVAMNDEHFEIRELTICIIARLCHINPAYIMPSLRKTLIQLLTEMEFSGVGRNKEQSARMLGQLVANAPTLIRPYIEPILKVLVPKLKEADLNRMVITSVLRAIGDLSREGLGLMSKYVNELLPMLLNILNDSSSSQKREVCLWTLSQLILSTGYVIEPYHKYPSLLDTLLGFLRTEQRPSIRMKTLQLLGLLGALDPYKHKMNIGQIDSATVTSAPLIPMSEMNDLEQSWEMTPSELFVNMGTSSLDDFYPSVAIATLMKIIRDPTLSQHHTEVVQAVTFIFRALGIKSVPYIPQVIPSMINVIRSSDVKFHDNLFRQMGILISIVQQHIRKYLEDIFTLIREFWTVDSPLQPTIIGLVENISSALGCEFKIYLPLLIPQILRVLAYDSSRERQVTGILLKALIKFGNTLSDYMHLILPKIVALVDMAEVPIMVRRSALVCIANLSETLDFSEYASLIIHPIVRCLDKTPELRPAAMDTLAAIVNQLGKKYVIFIPMVKSKLNQHKLSHQRYDILCARVMEGGTPSDFDDGMLRYPRNRRRTDAPDQGNTTGNEGMRSKRLPTSANLANLQEAWTVSRRVSKDDWLDWYSRLCSELLKASPSPALRACWTVAQHHSQLAKDLFNASFVSCWTELDVTQQDELMKSLEEALKFMDSPEISQTILNLAEFMEHCDKGPLPLDPILLGETAIRCKAYAKALHYKEDEFIRQPKVPVLEALISINNKLGQKEAAAGLLEWGEKNLEGDLQVQERWHEKLHDWEKALKVYQEKSELTPNDPELISGQMRCLEALGEWGELHEVANKNWEVVESKEGMPRLAASAALGMGDWPSMAKATALLPRESQDGAFYRAILCIHQEQWIEACNLIDLTRNLLDTEIAALSSESYQRAYPTMVAIQMLAELEEVIEYKLNPERQEAFREMWWKRLQGVQRVVEDWQRIMHVRSLVISPQTDQRTWLKYASLCRKSGRLKLSHRTLVTIMGSDPSLHVGEPLPTDHPQATFAYCKHIWATEQKELALTKLKHFVESFLKPNTFSLMTRGDDSNRSTLKEMSSLLARCYHKLGQWQDNLHGISEESIPTILQYYAAATEHDSLWYKAWHSFAVMNFETILFYKHQKSDMYHKSMSGSVGAGGGSTGASSTASSSLDAPLSVRSSLPVPNSSVGLTPKLISFYGVPALEGFVKSISLSKGSSLQDTLRLLTLLFDYGHQSEMYEALHEGVRTIAIDNWLQVIPQLIARIDTPRHLVSRLIHQILMDLGKFHPQALVYSLTVACKSNNATRKAAANKILNKIKENNETLVNQAMMVSDELIRVAILWHEQWHEGLEEASRLYFGEKNIPGMLAVLEPLHQMLEQGPQTLKETSFHQAYGNDLNEAKRCCQRYRVSDNNRDLNQAWDLYYHVFRRISRQLPKLTQLELQHVSPQLLKCRNLELAVPGNYVPNRPSISIAEVEPSLQVITSKQRPRKTSIRGSDGKSYMFLLKGHEDLRQDERVMQFFSLVNSLLLNDQETFRRNLTIQRFAVIPLSTNSGLIGWVPNSDTLHALIKDYREKKKILLNIEHRIMQRMTPNADHLPLMNKVEVFEHSLESTQGDDLAKILLLKAPSSEVWFDRRTNFTRSLAVMSMVGYVLGLGDRHPSNLLLDRMSGKILHIDFGDCFEVAMTREKFPEKIPFRLTRMLINAMEVTGIEGTYRRTCESVMNVLRNNRDSLMAVLEAFVYDPLLNWRLMETGPKTRRSKPPQPGENYSAATASHVSTDLGSLDGAAATSNVRIENISIIDGLDGDGNQPEILNKKALDIIQRVRDKLTGRDFSHDEVLDIHEQVDRLIEQATNNENLCQSYIGWCPFW